MNISQCETSQEFTAKKTNKDSVTQRSINRVHQTDKFWKSKIIQYSQGDYPTLSDFLRHKDSDPLKHPNDYPSLHRKIKQYNEISSCIKTL